MPAPSPSELTVEQARSAVLGEVRGPLPAEEVALLDAGGRVLAADLVAPRDLPPWDNSQMDGYAVRSADLAPEARFRVIETVLAGKAPANTVGAGEATRIMTGAPMPAGADTVVPVESTAGEGRDAMRLTAPPPMRGDFVRARGEDVRAGTVAIPKGAVLHPAAVGVAASLGATRVPVHRRPVVAIVATGDELVDPGTDAGPHRIYASSSFALAAAVRRAGGEPRYHGIAADTRESLHAKLSEAIAGADILLTTGGVSVGEADYVKEILEALGVRMKFWRVAQKPGYPLAFGVRDPRSPSRPPDPLRGLEVADAGPTLVFGLPGNPVSTLVSYEEYVQPALLRMLGKSRVFLPVVTATLTEPLKGGGTRHQFLRGFLERGSGSSFNVRTTGNQSSGVLTSLLVGNALILVPPGSPKLEAGAPVQVQVLDPDFFSSFAPGF